MFRLISLELKQHPQLGDIKLEFIEESKRKFKKGPYTSVIIGPNGTGKSFILKCITEIFKEFESYKTKKEKTYQSPFYFHLIYQIDDATYEIVSSKWTIFDRRGANRASFFLKNRPPDEPIFKDDKWEFAPRTPYQVTIDEIQFPSRILVNSVMLNDRFTYHDSEPGEFYQYLGIRSSSSNSSTRASARRTITNLFNAKIANDSFVNNLRALLHFLNFDQSFKIRYKTKINSLFFSTKLDEKNFRQYFEHWWDPKFTYSNRSKENPIWSIPYYNKYFKGNKSSTDRLIKFLNRISSDADKLKHKDRSKSKYLEIDLFADDASSFFIEQIQHLENLDIVNLDGIKLLKVNSHLSIDEISSGEYHLLVSLIGIFSKIQNNSIVLIDEPEISLHPNWQMRYVSFLKEIFKSFQSCHFILTTHSHFLISDLEGKSSSVTALTRLEDDKLDAELLVDKDTYGWSTEDVLYRVFNLKTTSNYYLEIDLRRALSIIAEKSQNTSELDRILSRLTKLTLNPADPTNAILDEIKAYRASL